MPDGFVVLRDRVNGALYVFSRRRVRCASCAEPYREKYDGRRANLILDHTWVNRSAYFLTVLCISCNSRKQGKGYVGGMYGHSRWYPGMRPIRRAWNGAS